MFLVCGSCIICLLFFLMFRVVQIYIIKWTTGILQTEVEEAVIKQKQAKAAVDIQRYFILSCLMTKPTKWHVRPAKTQISLGSRPVWSERCLHEESSLSAQRDSDQTGPIPRLIWVFAGHTCHFVCFVMRWLIVCLHNTARGSCFMSMKGQWSRTDTVKFYNLPKTLHSWHTWQQGCWPNSASQNISVWGDKSTFGHS